MQIFEHEHQRAPLGECLEEATPGSEGLVAAVAPKAGLRFEPDQRAEMGLDPAGIVVRPRAHLRRRRAASRPHLPRFRLRGCRPAP